MKSNTLLALAFASAFALSISSCQQDPGSANNAQITGPLSKAPATPAHPAITYVATVISHNNSYATLGVMDTDASHSTNIVTASSTSEGFSSPSWSYSGGSIAYRDGTSGSTASSIKAVDVSVNSSGVPVASNARTIYSLAVSDSAVIQSGPAWCATSSTGKIAFTRNHLGSQLGLAELCTISQSGGSVTVLQTASGLNSSGIVQKHFMSPTWSPDDSKIAVIRRDTNIVPNGTTILSTILIVNASTGAAIDSIKTTMAVNRLEWSRTGTDELAFTASTGSAYTLYYVAPSTGSTITGNGVDIGNGPTWSPNNSSIFGSQSGVGLIKLVPFTTSTTVVATSGGGSGLNWKR